MHKICFRMMINYDGTNSSVNSIIYDLSEDHDPLKLVNTTFKIAVEVSYIYQNETRYLTGHDSFLNLSIGQVIQTIDNNGDVKSDYFSTEYQLCGESGFQTEHENIKTRLNISETFLCPEASRFELQGNSMADLMKYGMAYVGKWQNDTQFGIVCEDLSTIESIVDTIQVKVAYINTYFDFNDYDNPVHTFVEQRTERGIKGFTRYSDIYIRENEAVLQDNYFAITPSEDHRKFIHVDIYNDRNLDNSKIDYVVFSFYKSYQKVFYERSVLNFLDALGALGGVFGILSGLGYIFVSNFADRTFYYSILSSIYQVDTLGCQIDHDKDKSYLQNLNKSNLNERYEESKHDNSIPHDEDISYNSSRWITLSRRHKFRQSYIYKASK